jgi:hypothetical protein
MQRSSRWVHAFAWVVVIGCRSPAPASSSEHRVAPIEVVAPSDGAVAAPSDGAVAASIDAAIATATHPRPPTVIRDDTAPRTCTADADTLRACQAQGPNFVYGWKVEPRCKGTAPRPGEDDERVTCACFDRVAQERRARDCSMRR